MAESLLSQLDKVGLGVLKDIDIFAKDEKEIEKAAAVAVASEADFVFEKTCKCPVCDTEFKTKAVKTGKAKLLGIDSDLRPRYQGIDALKYDSIVCTKCGYAALSRFFNFVTGPQIKAIQSQISTAYKPEKAEADIYTYDEAVLRHQLALANAVVKDAKESERAYICLKLAWLMRGEAESLSTSSKDYEKNHEELLNNEKQYIDVAYKGFMIAMSKELFPICGMDEWTYTYLVAELAKKIEDYATCLRLVSDIIVSKTASSKLKDKARELRKSIKDEV